MIASHCYLYLQRHTLPEPRNVEFKESSERVDRRRVISRQAFMTL